MYPKGKSGKKSHEDEKIVAPENDELDRIRTRPSDREQFSGLSEIIESLDEHIDISGSGEKEDEEDIYGDPPYYVMQRPIKEIIGIFPKNIPKRVVLPKNHFDSVVTHCQYEKEKDKSPDTKKIDSLESHI